jgi:DNA-binding transcriptional LysR family regulator
VLLKEERVVDIDDLETFVEVADAGGISLAARRMGVAKSVVSRRLARLEAELGIQLLSRTTRGAALTEAGLTFRDHAARVCAEIDIARESILPTGDLHGRLRIAAPLSFGPTHLAPLLAKLARRHPRLHVHAYYSDRVVDVVTEGFDCAIRVGYLKDSSLLARRVASVRGQCVASPAYLREHGAPETPDELLGHEALMQGTESWRFSHGESVASIHPRGRFKADNGVALTRLGIAALPDFLISEHIASGALVPVLKRYPLLEGGIYVVRPPGSHPVRKIRILTELLFEAFGKPNDSVMSAQD